MIALGCALIPFFAALLVIGAVVKGRGAILTLLLASFVDLLLAGYTAWQRTPGSTEFFGSRYFVIDASSVLFLALIAMIFFGIAIYVAHRFTSVIYDQSESPDHYCGRALLFFSASAFAVLSNHLLAMWLFLELGTLAIAPLIFFGRGQEAVAASWKYLMFSIIGLGFNFMGLMCIART
jgi:formate hydrogenlyase subunit 3/multisubunit Na+/H+ antiporter MnhD subunit